MPITLVDLPYPSNALEPAISAATLDVHHGKHHKAYVDKTNELTKGTDLENADLETIVAEAANRGDTKLHNQSAQAWNHGFYWFSLSPSAQEPTAQLDQAITSAFGSREQLVEKLIEKGAEQFGSGWAWLVADGAGVSIETTHDAAQPKSRPLLVVDVWEHAYYLDRKNDRKAYLKAVADKLAWDFASENFARESVWTYPA